MNMGEAGSGGEEWGINICRGSEGGGVGGR